MRNRFSKPSFDNFMAKDKDENDEDQEEGDKKDTIKVEAEAVEKDMQIDDQTPSINDKRKLTYYSLGEHLRWLAINQLLISDSPPAFHTLVH